MAEHEKDWVCSPWLVVLDHPPVPRQTAAATPGPSRRWAHLPAYGVALGVPTPGTWLWAAIEAQRCGCRVLGWAQACSHPEPGEAGPGPSTG